MLYVLLGQRQTVLSSTWTSLFRITKRSVSDYNRAMIGEPAPVIPNNRLTKSDDAIAALLQY